jgi:23S rRNA (adenine2503-C2)-methyltransferase
MNSVYDIQTLEKRIRDPYERKKFLNAYVKKALPPEECSEMFPDLFQGLEQRTAGGSPAFQCLELLERHDSQIDGATKLVFSPVGGTASSPSAGTEDGAPPQKERIEAVILRIASGRTSLCISSQIGCAAGCGFCATGKLGFIRNLTSDEMLDQVLLAKRLLREEGRALRNVVVMGMGEPLHNEENLFQTLETLRDPRYFNVSENHLLVSTVGVPDAMVRFAERFPNIRLALSLHSARQDVREKLMPVSRVHTLEKIKNAVLAVEEVRLTETVRPTFQSQESLGRANRPGEPKNNVEMMIEILLLKGINDSPEELSAIIEFLSGIQSHINLIQFNAHPGATYEPVTPEARTAFGDALKNAGFKVTLRYSLGDDIAAACGQLAGQ